MTAYVILALVAAQRLAELVYAQHNTRALLASARGEALEEIAGKYHQHEMDPFYMSACTVCIAKATLARSAQSGDGNNG